MVESESVRTFIALRPEPRVVEQLAAQVNALQRSPWAREVRWIAGENIHLTLRFLGSTPADTVEKISTELRELAACRAFPYRIDHIAFFPNARRPRVVAAQLVSNDALLSLVEELEQIAQGAGFAPEPRAFRAHLTLGRTRRNFPRGARMEHTADAIEGLAREIVLFRSDTLPSGAVYTPITTVLLDEG